MKKHGRRSFLRKFDRLKQASKCSKERNPEPTRGWTPKNKIKPCNTWSEEEVLSAIETEFGPLKSSRGFELLRMGSGRSQSVIQACYAYLLFFAPLLTSMYLFEFED